jgi:hypothetical protein
MRRHATTTVKTNLDAVDRVLESIRAELAGVQRELDRLRSCDRYHPLPGTAAQVAVANDVLTRVSGWHGQLTRLHGPPHVTGRDTPPPV